MNGLSDSITIGIVLTLVFGALFFYLYSRLVQNEKRVSLMENILLDLKMTADSSWGASEHNHSEEEQENTQVINHIEPVSAPEELKSDDVDNEEDVYKEILAQTDASSVEQVKNFDVTPKATKQTVNVTKVQPNYSAMTVKELKSLAKSRGLTVPSGAGRKELTDSLRKLDGTQPTVPEAGSFLGSQEGAPIESEGLGEVETL
jgi:hypothetical protein